MKLSICLVFYIAIFCTAQAGNPWERFVTEPTEKHFRQCELDITESFKSGVHIDSTSTYKYLMEEGVLYRYQELLSSGNEYSAELYFQLRDLLRGYPNIVQHLTVRLGHFFKKEPVTFLELFEKYRASDKRLECRSFIGSYGEKFVDNWPEMIKETKERLAILRSIPDNQFSEVRDKCIESIVEKLDELERSHQGMIRGK